jgi:hypothetical protein
MVRLLVLGIVLTIGLIGQAEELKANIELIGKSDQEQSGRIPISKKRYVTGGIFGSAVGLGIGHAIQGRYLAKGLMFSVTEVVGLGLLSSANCYNRQNERDVRRRGDCDDTDKALLGAGLWLGFHIWEVIDIWTGARPVKQAPAVSLLMLPTESGPLLSLSFAY